MPGLVGVVSQAPGEAARRFDAARDRMLRHGPHHSTAVDAFHGLGRVGVVSLHPAALAAPGTNALFHGVLYNAASLWQDLGAGAAGSDADLCSALYRREGTRFISRLEGEFCLAIVDESSRRVVLASDTIGNYPLYWHAARDSLVFASDLSALLRTLARTPSLDLRAVADYLTLGAIVGNRTLAAGVSLLDPGTILTWDLQSGRVSQEAYVKVESFFQGKSGDRRRYLEAVGETFFAAVERASRAPRTGLSLSGGLDSRAILSAIPADVPLRTYTLGVEGCADQVIAQRLSTIAGTQHVFFRLDSTYLRDFLPNMAAMVSITDGMYLSHGLTEMLAIRFLGETGISVLLRGHGGELAKAHLAWPLHTDAAVHGMSSLDELVPYLSRRSNYVTGGLPLSNFMTPAAAAEAGPGTSASFADSLKGTGLSPADACSFLYLRELHRRFTIPSLELFRTCVDVRLPYVDPQFLRVLLAAPPAWRDSTEIHTHLTKIGRPRLLRVRNSNTGARANAGAREEWVLDKVNTILKRLHVYGYRHYHNFDEWMKRMLLESVQAELLSPNARVQQWVSRPALEGLIQEMRSGSGRSYLLQILLILELWQRENDVSAA